MLPFLATKTGSEDLTAQFDHCYEENYRSVHRFLLRLTACRQEADDLVQEAFIRLWKEMSVGRMPADPRPWLYKVASNLAISRFRSRSRVAAHETHMEQDTLGKTVSFADAERSAICRETLKLALAQLPEPMRVCLLLYHEGLSGNEIAATIGIKPSYVSTLVLRAHQRFRRECEQLGVAHGLL